MARKIIGQDNDKEKAVNMQLGFLHLIREVSNFEQYQHQHLNCIFSVPKDLLIKDKQIKSSRWM